MPNNITTIIKAPKHVIDSMVTPANDVDFCLIIPEPENLERGNCNVTHDPGVICWHTWRPENWGTKWNAYDTCRSSDTEIQFDTAWNAPHPVLAKLSQNFPEDVIEVKYADEDLGYNFYHFVYHHHTVTPATDLPDEGTDEAVLWAYRLKYDANATMDTLRDVGYFDDSG